LNRKRLIDNWDLLLILSIIGIPFALWRIASKWEDNNEAEYNEINDRDREIKNLKAESNGDKDGHYTDEENLERWT